MTEYGILLSGYGFIIPGYDSLTSRHINMSNEMNRALGHLCAHIG